MTASCGRAASAVIAEVKRASPEQGRARRHRRPGGPGRASTRPAAPTASACSPRSAASAAASPTWPRSAPRSTSRCCARTSSSRSYQLWEARAYGADLVLLIVAALEQPALVSLGRARRVLGLTALVEVHDERRGRPCGRCRRHASSASTPATCKTLEVDRDTFARVSPGRSPPACVKIAESGVRGPARPHRLRRRRAPTRCSSARAWSTGQDPRSAVHDLVDRRGAPGARARPRPERALTASTVAPRRRRRRRDLPDAPGHFGPFGGRFVPEALDRRPRRARRRLRRPRSADPAFIGRARPSCSAPTPAGPSPLTERHAASPSTAAARGSSSSARTSTTPARTRSTTCSARRC